LTILRMDRFCETDAYRASDAGFFPLLA